MPGNLQNAVHMLASGCSSFTDAVRGTMHAGGCSSSRAMLIGACVGADKGIGGEEGIPQEWIDKTDVGQEALELALQLVE